MTVSFSRRTLLHGVKESMTVSYTHTHNLLKEYVRNPDADHCKQRNCTFKLPLFRIHLDLYNKGKVARVFFLTEHHAMKAYWGNGGTPRILDLGTKWERMVSFAPRPLYLQGKSPCYPLAMS